MERVPRVPEGILGKKQGGKKSSDPVSCSFGSSRINGVSVTCLRRGHPKALQDSATGVPSVLLENLDAPSLQRQIPAGGCRERRDNGPEVPAEGELIAAPEPGAAPWEKLGGGSRREFCPGAGRAVETRLHPQRIPGSTFPGPWCSFLGHTAFPAHPEPPRSAPQQRGWREPPLESRSKALRRGRKSLPPPGAGTGSGCPRVPLEPGPVPPWGASKKGKWPPTPPTPKNGEKRSE